MNGKALCEALVRAAKRHGAVFRKGSAVLQSVGQKIIGVEIEGEPLHADEVVVTTGAWAKELCKPLGIEFQIEPQKAQIVHLELPEMNTDAWPVVMPPTNQYLLAFEGGKVIAGATHEDNVGYDTRVTVSGLQEILEKALAVAPGLASGTVVETKVGFRPVAPGFLPVIGKFPGFEGIFVANGLGSSGLTVGPYLGAELAKLVRGETIEIDLERYDVAGAITFEQSN
ncbi:D-amino acid dehydrogenase small subunit [Halalkalibacter wakoensis JCM 9140]|uniref:D-amino acid dehydrogenase small subunit n=1 Tax=Halalkalibacter wakoensis JCM 9140 TaxID=1236970 RepID=W4Q3J1_9BACI|nr:D-amino acid dehydrogenase small subunit [Halalkalibacter wakoensis JCM 9140]